MNVSRLIYSGLFLPLVFFLASAATVKAQLLAQDTRIERDGGGVTLQLTGKGPAPFLAYTLDNPRRLVVDLGDTSLSGMPSGLARDMPEISAVRYGLFQPEQARIVVDLNVPMVIQQAQSEAAPGQAPIFTIRLVRTSEEAFRAQSVSAAGKTWDTGQPAPAVEGQAGKPLIAIDAGHGGVDQGAVVADIQEKDITLQMARQLRDVLLQNGAFRVVLTRNSDVFVPLGERVEIARRAGAVAFVSLHADVVTRGRARGTTVFSLSEADTDQQALTIATLENRADLVAGISVEGEDDEITSILLQMAHRETDALSNRFADIMAESLWFQNEDDVKSRRMAGGFRVLRAPEIPSVLIEMGFMSDATDLAKLQDPDWQLAMAESLQAGLGRWLAVEDDMRGLLRN